jgi:hypothetical protein
MMNSNRSALYLIELIFAVLFFVLTATVCTQILAVSTLNSKEAQLMNQAVDQVTILAEYFKAYDGDLTKVSFHYQNTLTPQQLIIDQDGYQLVLTKQFMDGVRVGKITCYYGEQLLLEQTIVVAGDNYD